MLLDHTDLATSLSTHPPAALLAVYAGGVLTSLTPCLYPMIPVTVSIVGGSAGAKRRSARMVLAAIYVLGLAAAYA
ncbi:MAG: cytochrome c biogenesis protein CcdA, partial [Gemmatimonadaceae bacterium]